jgi:uncharacterized membrane protein YfcA
LEIITLFLPLLGFIVGNLIGLTGIGGGFLMTPALLLIGVPPVTAVGTDLLYASISKALGVTVYARRRNVNRTILLRLLVGGIPATFVGYYLMNRLNSLYGPTAVNSIVGFLLALLLLLVSSIYIVQMRRWRAPSPNNSDNHIEKRRLLTIAIGFMTGLAVQFTSIGSGVLITFFLLYFISEPGRVVGTELSFGLVITSLGGALHLLMGNPDLFILLLLLAGAAPGIILGTRMNKRIQIGQFRIILFILMMIAGAALLVNYGFMIPFF